jgi:hypothetical protein
MVQHRIEEKMVKANQLCRASIRRLKLLSRKPADLVNHHSELALLDQAGELRCQLGAGNFQL